MNIRQEKIPKHPLGAAAFSHCRVLWGGFSAEEFTLKPADLENLE